MASNHGKGKMRMNTDGDRLSSLPIELIHKILSFIDMTEAIGTGALSSKWRFVWTSMPHLNFSSERFSTLPKFYKFIKHVMPHLKPRNDLTKVYSVKLNLRIKAAGPSFLKRILDHVLSHNIQQLDVVCLLRNDIEFPLCHFTSHSLKHLNVKMNRIIPCGIYPGKGNLTSGMELPALMTLVLHSFTLCDDNADTCIGFLSNCVNLENLTLKQFAAKGSNSFIISLPRLSNLTLEDACLEKDVNVATPHLKCLTIKYFNSKLVISAPELISLLYKGPYPWKLHTEGFNSLEMAHICVPYQAHIYVPYPDSLAHDIVCLLQRLHGVKFLTLNLEIVELLSSSAGLNLPQPSPFVNLKSLKIYPDDLRLQGTEPKVAMSTEVKSYLLGSSPGCIFTIALREEIIAQKHMDELAVLLEKEKNDTKTSRAHLDPGKILVKGNMAQMNSCWEKLSAQIERARLIISKLQLIEELLMKLPLSHRDKIQPCFSNQCAEAQIAISKITDQVKIQCDENQSCSNVCFRKLATTLKMFS